MIDNKTHAPVYGVTIGEDWVSSDLLSRFESQDLHPCIVFGTEEEARRWLEMNANRMGKPAALFRIVKMEVSEVMEG